MEIMNGVDGMVMVKWIVHKGMHLSELVEMQTVKVVGVLLQETGLLPENGLKKGFESHLKGIPMDLIRSQNCIVVMSIDLGAIKNRGGSPIGHRSSSMTDEENGHDRSRNPSIMRKGETVEMLPMPVGE